MAESKRMSRLGGILREAGEKSMRESSRLDQVAGEIRDLIRLVQAWAGGRYREIPWRSIGRIVAALVYFINPFDAIPDFLPALGLVDDIGVIGFVVNSLRRDIDDFRVWEKSAETPPAFVLFTEMEN